MRETNAAYSAFVAKRYVPTADARWQPPHARSKMILPSPGGSSVNRETLPDAPKRVVPPLRGGASAGSCVFDSAVWGCRRPGGGITGNCEVSGGGFGPVSRLLSGARIEADLGGLFEACCAFGLH
jgi:hypothetical protein